jgi:hypothetical protein
MRMTLSVSVLVTAATLNLLGASLAGVTLPDSTEVGGRTLVLNGLGLRTRFMIKVYVAGLYLEKKSSDADAIIKADAPKRMVLHFLRSVSRDQMVDAYTEAFDANAPGSRTSLKAEIARLMAAFEPVAANDQMVFTYQPGVGTTLTIRGTDKVTIAGLPFAQAMFSAWLGPKPPSADLKKGLLGL